MVKRPKSPDPSDDAKYFTVYQPYPLNANWELPADCIKCAFWIANCIGPDALFALHYKPKARGMVLLEVDKSFPDSQLLLGEHRWSEFLRDPIDEEKDRVSQIFYCLYDNGRAAQKDGWKRIHVEGSWFKDWSMVNSIVNHPYPETYWCPLPPEDKTNKSLCRPLPVAVKPPPPKDLPPVVGSAVWVAGKGVPTPTPQAIQGAWAKGRTAQAKANAPKPAVPKIAPRANAWNKPIITNKPTQPTPRAGPSAPPAWGITRSAPSVPNPPGHNLPTPPHTASNSPSPLTYPSPPGLTRNPSNAPQAGPSSIAHVTEQLVNVTLSPSQERNLYLLGEGDDDEEEFVSRDPTEENYLPEWETAAVRKAEQDIWNLKAQAIPEVVDENLNLWGADEERPKPEVILCPTHGIACKKGICKDMAKIVRDMERAKTAKPAGRGKQGSGGGGWGKKGTFREFRRLRRSKLEYLIFQALKSPGKALLTRIATRRATVKMMDSRKSRPVARVVVQEDVVVVVEAAGALGVRATPTTAFRVGSTTRGVSRVPARMDGPRRVLGDPPPHTFCYFSLVAGFLSSIRTFLLHD
ncbi:hypothetical protein BDQ12DRAFT_657809 [Crucibulum laeve]|uniref:Uncharacterized protein n=1 Tax=Crucibulum laeve TaxID=68775 RepID=A0A5C3LMM4_9AGAR|nr:hypothetical protein BDQ12DRAFT_657809 [Crucibulum laeve]